MSSLRIGHGFDVHKFGANRALIIGGVKVPYEKGLEGYSDADVLVHAIMDALLGAVGLGDIGQQFPPSDAKYKDANSVKLLAQVLKLVRAAGCVGISNVDTIIMAEEPKLSPYIPAMAEVISEALEIERGRVSIKATTTEKLGFVGRGEGMAASAVCLVTVDD